MNNAPVIIGITGPFGSGKTTASVYFETKGFFKIILSSFLEEELGKQGKEITRENLQDLGNLWRKQNGSGILAQKALDYIFANNIEKVVVDGIRNLGEVEVLKKSTKFVLLGVVADRDVRFSRVKNMANRESMTRGAFDRLDMRDLGLTEDLESGLQVAKCLAVSDFFIDSNNESTYKGKLDEILTKI